MKFFTDDETGEKYESVAGTEGHYTLVIKLVVRAEERYGKWHVVGVSDTEIKIFYTPDTEIPSDIERHAIQQAIKGLMEYVQAPYQKGEKETIQQLMDTNEIRHRWAEKARKALRDGGI